MPQYNQLARCFFKRARRGLFGGERIQFGDNVSEDGGNRTRRRWRPNVRDKRLFSAALGRLVPLKVTTKAIRDIDEAGGLDRYLIHMPKMKVESDRAWQLKQQILAARREAAKPQQPP